jgi:hypothetical protein
VRCVEHRKAIYRSDIWRSPVLAKSEALTNITFGDHRGSHRLNQMNDTGLSLGSTMLTSKPLSGA